ncbi:hypothetical protein ACVXZ4_04180 [Lacisediminihabitans sp. FW035]
MMTLQEHIESAENTAREFRELFDYLELTSKGTTPLAFAAKSTLAEMHNFVENRAGYVTTASDIYGAAQDHIDEMFDMDDSDHEDSWAVLYELAN